MRRYLTVIILIFSVLSSFGQTEKGRFLVGAGSDLNFNFLSTQSETDEYESDKIKDSSFEISTDVGYFIANNFAVGIGMIYSNSTKKEDEDKFKSSTFAAGPFVRYYFGQQKIKPFLHSALAFGKSIEEYDTSYMDDKNDYSLISYEFGGGISLAIAKNIACELGLAYGVANASFTDYYNQDVETTAKGIAGNFGFTVFL